MENTETKTEKQWQGNFADVAENTEKVVETPIFIIFAEYLGYVSRFISLAVDWCDGKIPDIAAQKVMMVEAKSIFRQMLKDYTKEEVKFWYATYHPVILCEFEEKLAKTIAPSED